MIEKGEEYSAQDIYDALNENEVQIKRALAQQPPVNVELLEWLSDATSIFEWVMYNRDNQDLSHTDFRIKVSEMANDYLSHNIINARAEQKGQNHE